jgi:F-type H+-transporting ATPase subunit b
MESVLNVSPGLMIWTLINFFLLLLLLIKFGVKPILNGLRSREAGIRDSIDNATKANQEAQKLLIESQEKLQTAQKDMSEIIHKGRIQAEEIINKASVEADRVKRQKVDEATKEIERSKESAILALRSEVAGLVVIAAEKLLGETLDKDKHTKLVESYIEKLPKN